MFLKIESNLLIVSLETILICKSNDDDYADYVLRVLILIKVVEDSYLLYVGRVLEEESDLPVNPIPVSIFLYKGVTGCTYLLRLGTLEENMEILGLDFWSSF